MMVHVFCWFHFEISARPGFGLIVVLVGEEKGSIFWVRPGQRRQ